MRIAAFFSIGLIGLTLTGCASPFDPFARPGNWSNTGASREDLAQQVANPSDLITGHGDAMSSGVVATAGIDKALGASGVGTASGLQTAAAPVASSSN